MESVVKLNRKLGVGGRGIVYEGFDHAKGQFVAVKEMPYMEPSTAGDEEDTELVEILSELACMREAQHPNLVQYYGARRSAVGVQIIMEYVSGGSLDYVLTRCGPLREAVARSYTRDILEALQYLHEVMHVCHRDVKPANILITPEGRCKLADFGVAKHVEEATTLTHTEPSEDHLLRQKKTEQPLSSGGRRRRQGRFGVREGYLQTAVGTPWYMAPEVINGGVDDDDEDDDVDGTAGINESREDGGNTQNYTAIANESAEAAKMWEAHLQSSQADASLEDWFNLAPLPSTVNSPDPSPPPLYSSASYYNPLKHILRKGRLHRGSVGYTTRADIWSVGVTVYEMITGTRPFGADLHNPSAVMFRIANCATVPPRLPSELQVSPTLQNFLDLCFVYDKELRATARELLGHPWLRGALSEPTTAAHEHVPPQHLSSSSNSVVRRPNSPCSRQHSTESTAPQQSPAQLHQSQQPSRPQQQQSTERRNVFDGVPLLDAMDLPAYPSAAYLTSTREKSSSASHCSGSREMGGAAASGQRSRPNMRCLSSATQPCSLQALPAAATTVEALLVSPAEQAEASSRYAAARQRIGHTRSSAPRTSAPQPNSRSGSSSRGGGGLRTKYGAYVDLLSHP